MEVTSNTKSKEREPVVKENVVDMANRLLGFNGWSSEIRNVSIDFVDSDPDTRRTSLGVSMIVRVTLASGGFHEEIGYGHVEDCDNKGKAYQKARESAVADGLQGAFRYFGDISKQCTLSPDSNDTTSSSSEPLRSGAPAETKHLHGTMTNDSGILRGESGEGEFGSDPFEELEIE
ncbi:hypothetical protein BKA66DRAFT_567145 [Pyrenochaeta sp. MPI-SDFR-AT-0127]|nr:hypothetical protein BKA66DRAFT_567145 [Pyrenochaeta sp. MPI-SDFR-AT-0127]